ncbi:MAG: hypothetical protein WC415_03330 [Patescibacteria group bacterium]|jgi:hypothetical protein
MNTLSWIVTILGFIATITGCVLAYCTYISPLTRLNWYLKKPKKWSKLYVGREKYHWHYKNHPEFIIEIDDEGRDWTVQEKWMPYCPDSSKRARFVVVRVNGQAILTEEFISLDAGRYFVPVARREVIGEPAIEAVVDFKYYYTSMQVMLSRIIGEYYRESGIDDFMQKNKIDIYKND